MFAEGFRGSLPTVILSCGLGSSASMYSRQGAYFQQEEPRLGNQYLEDSSLIALLRRLVPSDVLAKFEPDLVKFGDRVSTSGDILYYGRESELNPPKLVPFNAFGRFVCTRA